jgi:hypothetical protein
MVNKIIKNKGGLHNRLTQRIALKPFTLKLCKELTISNGVELSQRQIIEAYMIFGGVPYYWSLLKKGASLAQEIDRLIFNDGGEMYDEFSMLYASLFKKPEPYIKVISLLADKNYGMTRQELISAGGFNDNGAFTDILSDLEWCGFIRSYQNTGKQVKDVVYQLVDNYTVFYYTFVKNTDGFGIYALIFCFLIDYRCDLTLLWSFLFCLFYAINGFQKFFDLSNMDNNAVNIFMIFLGIGIFVLTLSNFTWLNLIHNIWLVFWCWVLYTPITALDKWVNK